MPAKMKPTTISLEIQIDAPLAEVWEYWTLPEHITQWNFATPEWACPSATNNLQPSGRFSWRMEAKDGSMGFDYAGIYHSIQPMSRIEKTLDDGRKVVINFASDHEQRTIVKEHFEADDSHDAELQRQGWQAILENFRTYAESQG